MYTKRLKITDPYGSYTVREEEEVEDMLKEGIDTLKRARILSASIERERPHYVDKKRRLPSGWQLDLHNMILDKGMVGR